MDRKDFQSGLNGLDFYDTKLDFYSSWFNDYVVKAIYLNELKFLYVTSILIPSFLTSMSLKVHFCNITSFKTYYIVSKLIQEILCSFREVCFHWQVGNMHTSYKLVLEFELLVMHFHFFFFLYIISRKNLHSIPTKFNGEFCWDWEIK